MGRIEQENLFTNFRRNDIKTEHVEADDCVWGVTAVAYNALVKPDTPLTGKNLRVMAESNNLTKENLEEIIDQLPKNSNDQKFRIGYINANGAGKDKIFDFYSRIIDSNALILFGVDSKKWYHLLDSERLEHGAHALLVCGYETTFNKITRKEKRNLLIRDPNVKFRLWIGYELLTQASGGPLSLHDIVIFYLEGTKIQEMI